MVDWNGLLKWSTQYHDGTAPSNFKPMSKEDADWLESAMKANVFSDTDRLKELIDQLKAWSAMAQDKNTPPQNLPKDQEIVTLLEELLDLAELHPRNNMNICLMGGIQEILGLVFSHQSSSVRRQGCSILTAIQSNNAAVQEFAAKSGAINLTAQFDVEQDPKMKESVFNCLSSFLKGMNFAGKHKFITEHDGLNFLTRQFMCQEHTQRLRKKFVMMMYDLVLNDDSIFKADPMYVRKAYAADQGLISEYLKTLAGSDLTKMQEVQMRDYILQILFRVHQVSAQTLGPILVPQMYALLNKVGNFIEENKVDPAMKDLVESLEETKTLIESVIAAPSRPMTRNFEESTPLTTGEMPKVSGASLASRTGELTEQQHEMLRQARQNRAYADGAAGYSQSSGAAGASQDYLRQQQQQQRAAGKPSKPQQSQPHPMQTRSQKPKR